MDPKAKLLKKKMKKKRKANDQSTTSPLPERTRLHISVDEDSVSYPIEAGTTYDDLVKQIIKRTGKSSLALLTYIEEADDGYTFTSILNKEGYNTFLEYVV